jgi:alpha-1,3-rhamnosyl/mannosyltransferase
MVILFDASNLFSSRGGGVYSYLVKFLPHLIRRVEGEGDAIAFLHLYFRGKTHGDPALLGRRIVPFRIPVRFLNHLWVRLRMPDLSRMLPEYGIVHSPHFSLPVMSRARKILTVNDITYLKHPEYFAPSGKGLNDYGYRFLLPANVRRANRIIAISEHTKRDLVEHFALPAEKISVVHIGCDIPAPIPQEDLSRRLARFGLVPGRYVYFPAGTIEPRKNIARTIKAFAAANRDGLTLAISGVGDTAWLGRVDDANVRFLRWDTDGDRNALYQGALFVTYPSLYEGFGMPVVEAMGNGKAVLTSGTTSLGEIAEGHAHTVDPEDFDALVAGHELLIHDHACREALARKSAARAVDFTWEAMAEKTSAVYRSLR